jgi:hypothetical protein
MILNYKNKLSIHVLMTSGDGEGSVNAGKAPCLAAEHSTML